MAVLTEAQAATVILKESDLIVRTTKGSGAGGQHRNKTETAIQITHIPTGLQVRCEAERSQSRNKEMALALLKLRLQESASTATAQHQNAQRRSQVGSGQRGDKIRTVRYQDGIVTNEQTKQKISLKKYLDGDWSGLI